MKKKRELYFPIRGDINLNFRKMKLTLILTLLVFVSFGNSFSQEKVTLDFRKATLKEILNTIEEKTDYVFLYRDEIFDQNKNYSINLQEATIEEVLESICATTDVEYEISNRQIILKPSSGLIGLSVRQQKEIRGTVTSQSTGEFLPGVTVIIKGTTIGTVTDFEGKFTLTIPADAEILQVSFVGMKMQELPIGSNTEFYVSLEDETIGLEEVVAVGYGTQSKRTVTGSIQTVSAEDLKDIPSAQLAQSLQGKVTGVQINQRTGIPGEALSIRVRGAGSINASTDPLYVVDGFPITGDLTGINPDEIENITILKDASSTALYGSRAANGVVLIETKKASVGRTNVEFSAYYGIQSLPQSGRPDLMNATEFAQFKKESYEDLGQEVPEAFQNPSQYGEGTDWYDVMFDPAPIQDYSLSLSSATERFSTSVVAGYFNQEGILLNSGYERFSLRMNSTFDVNEKLRFGFNVAPSLSKDFSPNTSGNFWTGNLTYNALLAWPIYEYKNPDGSLPLAAWSPANGGFPTPNYYRGAQEIKNNTNNLRLLSNAYIEVEPIKDLVFKSSINLQMNVEKSKLWNPSTASTGFATSPPVTNFLNEGYVWSQSWLNENTVTYNLNIDDHNIDLLGGYTVQKNKIKVNTIAAQNFPDDRINDVDAAVNLLEDGTDGAYNEWALISYLARANYSYQGRYNVSAVIRADGSSRFGSDNRWGYFPSVSASWVFSEEGFFPEGGLISMGKMRASWGVTGNNNIGNYTQFALVTLGENAIFGSNVEPGSYVENLSNTELGWETTNQLDIGIDIGILDNRVDLAYDYYRKKTTDLLYSFSIPQSSGFSSFMGNSGEIKFWGHEISIQSRNLVGEFKWNTNFNISFNDNEVVSLAENVDAIYGGGHVTRVGDRIGLFWGLVHDGVYDNQQEYDNSAKASQSAVGTVKFQDVNDDGEILNTDTGGDRTVIGDPTPKFIFGMTNTFNYKNFDLAITMAGSYGNDIANRFETGATNLDGVFNVLSEVKDRWRSPDNPGEGLYGTTMYNTGMERDWFNSRFIEDGSFLTIKNITLGYNVDVNRISFIKNLRVYGSIQQVYTFTGYSGNNPEVSDLDSDGGTSVLYLGDDRSSYPVPRTWTFGINVGF